MGGGLLNWNIVHPFIDNSIGMATPVLGFGLLAHYEFVFPTRKNLATGKALF